MTPGLPGAGVVRAVLDTDAGNQIDDQFAVVHALLAPDRIGLEALYAAPFGGGRSAGPADGMRRSHAELRRLVSVLGRDVPVLEGSTDWLPGAATPRPSPAASDLIARACAGDTLYVLAIGAPTTVASALLAEPGIAGRIVVVWLGGHPSTGRQALTFNVEQDVYASRVLLDSGVPLVHVPCRTVAEHLRTTAPEIEAYVRGRGPAGDYLAGLFGDHVAPGAGVSAVLWDLAVVAWLIDPAWVPTAVVPSPLLTPAGTWRHDPARHRIREAYAVDRDAVFADLFRRLSA